MKTNLREQSTRYQCFIRPKVHFAPEFSFKGLVHPKMKKIVINYSPACRFKTVRLLFIFGTILLNYIFSR